MFPDFITEQVPEQNFFALFFSPFHNHVENILAFIQNNECLTSFTERKVKNHPKPHVLDYIFSKLDTAEVEDRKKFIMSVFQQNLKVHTALKIILERLYDACLLKSQCFVNFHNVNNFIYRSEALLLIYGDSITVTDNYCKLIFSYHMNCVKLANGLKILKKANMEGETDEQCETYTEMCAMLMRSKSPDRVAAMLVVLKNKNLLAWFKSHILKHPNPDTLELVISMLEQKKLLNDENLIQLFKPTSSFLTNDYPSFWYGIDSSNYELTQEIFDHLILYASGPWPKKMIFRYQEILANGHRINADTHFNTINISTSESLMKLQELYGGIINGTEEINEKLYPYLNLISNNTLSEKILTLPLLKDIILAWVHQLPSGDYFSKEAAAKRFILDVISNRIYDDCKDEMSNITLPEALYLIILAMLDEEHWVQDQKEGGQARITLESVQKFVIQALYEIQRGYNINEKGDDNKKEDSVICPTGIFHKLINALQGIHQYCQIIVKTKGIAAQLFRILVKKEVAKIDPDVIIVTQEIWEHVKESVTSQLFEEYGFLYNDDIENAELQILVGNIEYIDLL